MKKIKIQIGPAGRDFLEHWEEQVPPEFREDVKIEFITSKPPPGGLGLAIPPEVVLAFTKGLVGAIGAGIGQEMWKQLRVFFERNPSKAPKQAKLTVGSTEVLFDPLNMPLTYPIQARPLDQK